MMSGRHHFNVATPHSSGNYRVVTFGPRRVKAKRTATWRDLTHDKDLAILLSLAKFERDDRDDDYRYRMTVNGLAFVITLALIAAGVWLAANLQG
jgi:hypothetical protein